MKKIKEFRDNIKLGDFINTVKSLKESAIGIKYNVKGHIVEVYKFDIEITTENEDTTAILFV